MAQIRSYYPAHITNQEFMLKEYLQYKILKIIFGSKYGAALCFLGGTALRIVYDTKRFSEDLDFDNFGLSFEEFDALAALIQHELALEGLEVEQRVLQKGAFHCYIKIPHVLYEAQLTSIQTQKVLIQIDTVAQGYAYTPAHTIINKFDVQALINTCSPALLLAQKLYTVFERKRIKGRDFYDILFLLAMTKSPDRGYLEQKLGITTPAGLTSYLLEKSQGLDFKALQADVQPFLFEPSNQSVILFPEYIKQVMFEYSKFSLKLGY